MPIVCWTGATVRCGNIYLGDPCIVLNHLQSAVSEQGLQCEQIAATSQVGNGEGMSKPMRITFLNLDFFAEVSEKFTEGCFVQSASRALSKERSAGIIGILAINQIAPQGAPSGFSQEDNPAFAAFGSAFSPVPHLYATRFLFGIADGQRAEFRSSQTCIKEKQNDRPIPLGRFSPL